MYDTMATVCHRTTPRPQYRGIERPLSKTMTGAQNNLGIMYENGSGRAPGLCASAHAWFNSAGSLAGSVREVHQEPRQGRRENDARTDRRSAEAAASGVEAQAGTVVATFKRDCNGQVRGGRSTRHAMG